MAMCPGMDLFNHTDKPGCFTKYDKNGYKLTADRHYEVGEEVLLSYGAHTNDVLWAEYGFMMDENDDDAVRIDEIVLRNVGKKDKRILEEYGYLGEYWLKKDGPCWRTEVAAWGKVLVDRQWKTVMNGTWMPNSVDKSYRRHRVEIEDRLNLITAECESSIDGLKAMSGEQILDVLGDLEIVLIAQGCEESEVANIKQQLAQKKHDMCLKRWEQIKQLSTRGAERWLSAW